MVYYSIGMTALHMAMSTSSIFHGLCDLYNNILWRIL